MGLPQKTREKNVLTKLQNGDIGFVKVIVQGKLIAVVYTLRTY